MIGAIQDDDTVRGGTGWGAEFAKLCNKPLFVFDQDQDSLVPLDGSAWETLAARTLPVITHPHFTGTGTRTIRDNSREELQRLFDRSFTS